MIIAGVFLRIAVAASLHRFNVNQHRPFHILYIPEQFQQFLQIMPVHRAYVFETKLLKHRAMQKKVLRTVPRFGKNIISRPSYYGHIVPKLFEMLFQLLVTSVCPQIIQMAADRTHVRINRHLVVIQYHNQVGIFPSGVIQGFIRQSSRHGTVSDYGNHMLLTAQ